MTALFQIYSSDEDEPMELTLYKDGTIVASHGDIPKSHEFTLTTSQIESLQTISTSTGAGEIPGNG